MISRIGTFSNAYAMMQAGMKTQARMADQQNQEDSGAKSTSFGGVGGDAGQLLNLSGQSARLTADNAAAKTATAYVQAAYSATGSISDLATTVRTQLSALLSGASADVDTANTAQNATEWLTTLQGQLNGQVGGAYLFSGQATDTAPVDFSKAAYDPTADPATADTAYYNGSATTRAFTASQGYVTALSVTASDPGFEELGRALSMIKANPGDNATLQSAYDLVSKAVIDIGSAQSAIGQQATDLDSLTDSNTDKITTLTNLSSDLNGADITTAAVLVTQYQTQLEAIYSTISKLSQDSILKYL